MNFNYKLLSLRQRLATIYTYPSKVNQKSLHVEKIISYIVAMCTPQLLASDVIQQEITKTKQMGKIIIAWDNSLWEEKRWIEMEKSHCYAMQPHFHVKSGWSSSTSTHKDTHTFARSLARSFPFILPPSIHCSC